MQITGISPNDLYIQSVTRFGPVPPVAPVPALGDSLGTPEAADRYEPSSAREAQATATYGPNRAVYT